MILQPTSLVLETDQKLQSDNVLCTSEIDADIRDVNSS